MPALHLHARTPRAVALLIATALVTAVAGTAAPGLAATRAAAPKLKATAIVGTRLQVSKTWQTNTLYGSFAPGGAFTPTFTKGSKSGDIWDIKKCHGGFCISSEVSTDPFVKSFRLTFHKTQWEGNLKGWYQCKVVSGPAGKATGSFVLKPVGHSAHPTTFKGTIVETYSTTCPGGDTIGPGIRKGTQRLKLVITT